MQYFLKHNSQSVKLECSKIACFYENNIFPTILTEDYRSAFIVSILTLFVGVCKFSFNSYFCKYMYQYKIMTTILVIFWLCVNINIICFGCVNSHDFILTSVNMYPYKITTIVQEIFWLHKIYPNYIFQLIIRLKRG